MSETHARVLYEQARQSKREGDRVAERMLRAAAKRQRRAGHRRERHQARNWRAWLWDWIRGK